MTDWQSVGQHQYRVQGEVLHFAPHGEFSLSQAETWLKVMALHFQRERHGLLLVDGRELKPPSSEIRRTFLSWLRDSQQRPRVIVFGASLLTRATSRLVLAAARQLYHIELELTQCAAEAEAWAHIQQMRRLGLSLPSSQ